MDRLRDGLAHPGGRAEHAVEPRVVDHLDDRRHAAALARRPAAPRRRGTRSRSRRWSGCRACPSGAGCASRCACRRAQRGTRKHDRPRRSAPARGRRRSCGAEQNHLCPVSTYSAAGAAAPTGRRGRVGAHVGATLLLGHRHADEARPSRRPGAAAGRSRRGDARLPLAGQLGLLRAAPAPPRRSSSSGSRRRPRPGSQHIQRRARDVRAGPRIASTAARAARARRRRRISSCQAGWNSTSSMRWPKRSWVRRIGLVLVRQASPLQRLAADLAAELRATFEDPVGRPRGGAASTSGRFVENRSTSRSGGGWLATSWVLNGAGGCSTVAMAILLGWARPTGPPRSSPEVKQSRSAAPAPRGVSSAGPAATSARSPWP